MCEGFGFFFMHSIFHREATDSICHRCAEYTEAKNRVDETEVLKTQQFVNSTIYFIILRVPVGRSTDSAHSGPIPMIRNQEGRYPIFGADIHLL